MGRLRAKLRHPGEFAVIVHDEFRATGLGSKLIDVMIGIAQEKGFNDVTGYIDSTNHRMLRVASTLGVHHRGDQRLGDHRAADAGSSAGARRRRVIQAPCGARRVEPESPAEPIRHPMPAPEATFDGRRRRVHGHSDRPREPQLDRDRDQAEGDRHDEDSPSSP